ncbi:MAG: bifunctional 23S rRNA (guanine(2069)-N(7))-methyltransferase RlmK/23S rRNA (guanine(2445)-N(2))-methyltransferase RlmL [Succinivibrio sp.]|nr:bifunctional 23S rRNA (guanine(2069)-N(7))-methyltransferase RlmK/23S rRNA (guanine(2445)-N(2))-methyltransferase RlmL [Succinivibrio sp.]
MSNLSFFATCPKGLESLLKDELNALGAEEVRETLAGVSFKGDFTAALKVCLWSRLASRVLMQLIKYRAHDDTELYLGAVGIAWENYFTPKQSIAVDFNGVSNAIRNTLYGAQRIKDAICDRLSKSLGARPNVEREHPDVRISCHLGGGEATVLIDLSGTALLKREFHRDTGMAPLKENLACAMLLRAGYRGGNFLDPMCGSGTLMIEAALLASDTAPGLKRQNWGFLKLKQFDETIWQSLKAEATVRSRRGIAALLERRVRFAGYDSSQNAVDLARSNLFRAGFEELSLVERRDLDSFGNPFADAAFAGAEPLTVVTNPPYGVRMGNFNELISVYGTLGAKLREHCAGATVGVISSSSELLSCLRLHATRSYKLYNGKLECQFKVYDINTTAAAQSDKEQGLLETESATDAVVSTPAHNSTDPKEALLNRLRHNLEQAQRFKLHIGTDACRIYDKDLPDYPAAVDCYGDYYLVYGYEGESEAQNRKQRLRALDIVAALLELTGVPGSQVILKSRGVKKGSEQYEKAAAQRGRRLVVREEPWSFYVNLEDYLDTGLFLDARLIRKYLSEHAPGKDFLNLFAYTCSASVCAAAGGAASTCSVDMSRTYLNWGRDNFTLNSLNPQEQRFVQADVLSWLKQPPQQRFDLVYVDPPTFSNSKRMSEDFDVRRDHAKLLGALTARLKDEAEVIFCTNRRGFSLSEELSGYGYECADISEDTLPDDFKRNAKIHHCYRLSYQRARQSTPAPKLSSGAVAPRWQKDLGTRPQPSSLSSSQSGRRSQRGPGPSGAKDSRPAKKRGLATGAGRVAEGTGRRGAPEGFKRGDFKQAAPGTGHKSFKDEGRARKETHRPQVYGPEGLKGPDTYKEPESFPNHSRRLRERGSEGSEGSGRH